MCGSLNSTGAQVFGRSHVAAARAVGNFLNVSTMVVLHFDARSLSY